MSKKNNIKIIGVDSAADKIVKDFEGNEKQCSKIISALQVLGNFEKIIEFEIYDTQEDEKESYIKINCFDSNDNMFVICPISSSRDSQNIIEVTSNDSTKMYDVSLLKKEIITKDNIEISRFFKKYDFKYGRLISDEKSFCSLFISDDVIYQMRIINNPDIIKFDCQMLLTKLNSLKDLPRFLDFASLFEELIKNKGLNMHFESFKDFQKNGELKFNSENESTLDINKSLIKDIL